MLQHSLQQVSQLHDIQEKASMEKTLNLHSSPPPKRPLRLSIMMPLGRLFQQHTLQSISFVPPQNMQRNDKKPLAGPRVKKKDIRPWTKMKNRTPKSPEVSLEPNEMAMRHPIPKSILQYMFKAIVMAWKWRLGNGGYCWVSLETFFNIFETL